MYPHWRPISFCLDSGVGCTGILGGAVNGYPAGQKCVVTWTPCPNILPFGFIVTVTGEPFVWRAGQMAFGQLMGRSGYAEGMVCQLIDWSTKGMYGYPVEWLRPLTDPDAKQVTTDKKERLPA